MSASWDCAVVGGGPAGAAAALVLARSGRSVLLIDHGPPGAERLGESLPGAARPILRDLGVLGVVERGPHLASYGNVSVWGSVPTATDFIADPHGLGWHLDRRRFDADLRTAAEAAGAVLRPGRVGQVARGDTGWRLLVDGAEVDATWLIDATGRRALAARRGLARRRRDDALVALYALALPHGTEADTRTWVESAPDGWWYSSRLRDGRRVVVLHVDADEAAAILHAPGAWGDRLAQTTHIRVPLEGAEFSAAPRGVEACGARLDRFTGPGWLAAGDAALSFDPLSAQGVFAALYTGMRSAQAVCAALDGARDAPEQYAARLESVRAAYRHQQAHYYGLERRWPDRPFWRRRQVQDTPGRR